MISTKEAIKIISNLNTEMEEEYDRIKRGPLARLTEIPKLIHTTTDFILELIQNADDAGSTEIEISLKKNRLYFYNNGDSFEEVKGNHSRQNVSSICKFLESTKIGKIGFMGLGFKSIFRISSKVEIHSKPFHFILDDRMCVPEWHNPIKKVDFYLEKHSKGSLFILYLKSKQREREDLIKTLDRIDPHTFLWLNHLTKLTMDKKRFVITKKGEDYEIEDKIYKKFESEPRLLTLKEKEDLISSRRLETMGLEKKKITRSVGISFALDKEECLTKRKGICYAFLPLPEVDLHVPFDVQGDFNVDLKRKNLKSKDSALNRWLFQQVGSAWEVAFKSYQSMQNIEKRLEIFNIVPLQEDSPFDEDEEIDENEPFILIKSSIDKFMKSNRVFLADSQQSNQDDWISAKSAFIPDKDVKELFTEKDLQRLHHRFARWIDPRTPGRGKKYLTEIIGKEKRVNCYKMIRDESVFNNIRNSPQQYEPKWFGKLAIALSKIHSKYNVEHWKPKYLTYQEIKRKIINSYPVLLADGEIIIRRGDMNEVYHSKSKIKYVVDTGRKFSYFINPKIFEWLEEECEDEQEQEERQKGLKFLRKVVKVIDQKTIIETIIIPHLEESHQNNWSNLRDDEIESIIKSVYVKKDCWSLLQDILPLKGNDNKFHKPSQLYLHPVYGNEFDAATFFSVIKQGRVLSRRYNKLFIKKKRKRGSRIDKNVIEFFKTLGVRTSIELEDQERSISKIQLTEFLGSEPKKTCIYGNVYYGYKLVDYKFPSEIRRVIKKLGGLENRDRAHKVSSIFVKELISNMDSYISRAKATYIWHDEKKTGKHKIREEPAGDSSWVRFLSNTENKWIPSTSKSGKDCECIRQVIMPKNIKETSTESSVSIFSLIAPLDAKYSENMRSFQTFFSDKGWEAESGVDVIIYNINQAVKSKATERVTYSQLYKTLYTEFKKLDKREINLAKEILNSNPWIYTPQSKKKYRKTEEVFWGVRDNLGNWKVDISPYYPSLEDFFTLQIGLGPLTPIDYLEFITQNLSNNKSLNKQNLLMLERCYRNIENAIKEGNEILISEIEDNADDIEMWCYGRKWLTSDDDLYYVDDEELNNRLKKSKSPINLVWLPNYEVVPLEFFKLIKIQPLSSLKEEPRVEYEELKAGSVKWVEKGIKKIIPDIKRVIRRNDKGLHDDLVKRDAFSRLRNINVSRTTNTRFIQPLKNHESIDIKSNFVVVDKASGIRGYIEDKFYNREESVVIDICEGLDSYLGNPLTYHLYYLLWYAEPKTKNVILRKEGVRVRAAEVEEEEEKEESKKAPPPVDELLAGDPVEVPVGPRKEITRRTKKGERKRATKGRGKQKPSRGKREKVDWTRQEVERRAIELIIDHENNHKDNEGYHAIDVHNIKKLGYDVVVLPVQISKKEYDEEKYSNLVKKFIEVKSSKKDSDDIVITDYEEDAAIAHGDKFYIYRVTDTMTENPHLYMIQNPIKQYGEDSLKEKKVLVIPDWIKRRTKNLEFVRIPFH